MLSDEFLAVEGIRRELLPALEPHEAVSADSAPPLLPDVGCTYLDYMGCTPYVDPSSLAATLARSGLVGASRQGPTAHSIAAITSLSPSAASGALLFGNPHSRHDAGRRSEVAVSELRRRTVDLLTTTGRGNSIAGEARHITTESSDISPQPNPSSHYVCVFTAGTTASCRLVADAIATFSPRCFGVGRQRSGRTAFFTHCLSHNSVLGMRGPLLRHSSPNANRNKGIGGRSDGSDSSDSPSDSDSSNAAPYGTFATEAELRRCFESLKTDDGAGEKEDGEKEKAKGKEDSTTNEAPPPPPPPPSRGGIVLVAFSAECNMSGTTFDIDATAAMIRRAFAAVFCGQEEEEKGRGRGGGGGEGEGGHRQQRQLLILCDGAAAFGKHSISLLSDRNSCGVDFFAFSYYKAFGSPTGLGGLLVRRGGGGTCGSNGGAAQMNICPLSLLVAAKAPFDSTRNGGGGGGGYFGGGSVAFVLPNKPHHGIKGAEAAATKLTPLLFGDDSGDEALSFVDDETLCQALEDGTPHYLGIANALQWLRLVALFPDFLSPAAVGRRIAAVRRYAVERLAGLELLTGLASVEGGGAKGIQFMRPGDAAVSAKLSPSHQQILVGSEGDGMVMEADVGSSLAFRIMGAGGRPEGHTVCEALLHSNPHYKVALRGGGFCNPGACEAFLGVTEADILETFGVANNANVASACAAGRCRAEATCAAANGGSAVMSRHQCFDANDAAPRSGRPLGCLRISFGLYSTPRDVDRLVAALRDLGLSEPKGAAVVPHPSLAPTTSRQPPVAENGVDVVAHSGGPTVREWAAPAEGAPTVSEPACAVATEGASDDCAASTSPAAPYRLHSLFVYPIKGCKPIVPTRRWPLGPRGLLYDRQWCIRLATSPSPALVGASSSSAEEGKGKEKARPSAGRALVPKECIGLAALQPSIVRRVGKDGVYEYDDIGDADEAAECEGRRFLRIFLPRTSVTVMVPADDDGDGENASSVPGETSAAAADAFVMVRRNVVAGARAGGSAAKAANLALSEELGMPVELIAAPAAAKVKGPSATPPSSSSSSSSPLSPSAVANFSNSGELLVVAKESHEAVLRGIERPEDAAHVSLLSYRPNIVVEAATSFPTSGDAHEGEGHDAASQERARRESNGCPLAYAELFWRSVAFASASPSSSTCVSLERREACLRCSQVGVDTAALRILQQPLASIRATCQRLWAALPSSALPTLGVTRNSIAFGAIFSPVLSRGSNTNDTNSGRAEEGHMPHAVLEIGMAVTPTLIPLLHKEAA